MGKLLILGAVILACISIGSTLNCYQCNFSFLKMGCVKKNITCSKADQVCANIDGSIGGKTLIRKKDCVDKNQCGTNSTEEYVKIKYTTTVNCCEGDTCNSATTLSSAHLSLSVALAMLGFWFTHVL